MMQRGQAVATCECLCCNNWLTRWAPRSLQLNFLALLLSQCSRLPPAFLVPQALLARQTSGMSGADLANLVNEAALLAAKLGADAIAPSMVDYAYDKVLMGVERKSAVRSPEALKRTAYHEGGHALVSGTVLAGLVIGSVH